MKKHLIVLGLALIPAAPSLAQKAKATTNPASSASTLLDAALQAMGGEEKLRQIKSLRLTGIGHTNFLEQSERPEGPYIVAYEQFRELRDVSNGRSRRYSEQRYGQVPTWAGSTTVYSEGVLASTGKSGRQNPGRKGMLPAVEERLALAPEKLLLTAKAASDLKTGKDTLMQGVPQQVLRFTWQGAPIRIFLNQDTHLPTATDLTRAYPTDLMWSTWGDVTTRTYYSYWNLEPGGLRLPRQLHVYRNKLPYQEISLLDLKLNAAAPADSFAITAEAQEAFRKQPAMKFQELPFGIAQKPAAEVVPGVVQVPGHWNVAFVQQPDGIVVIEAPISGGYAGKALDEAKKRFPNQPVKAVISTSDAWPHLAGVREVVAREVPLYILDRNKPLVERLLHTSFKQQPDALARQPHKPKLQTVSGKTTIGTGANRLELYPIRGEAGERMLMVYFPGHRLLYASDLPQHMPDGSFFMTEYLLELQEAVQREGLQVDTFFAMHMEPTPWKELEDAIRKEMQTSAP